MVIIIARGLHIRVNYLNVINKRIDEQLGIHVQVKRARIVLIFRIIPKRKV